MLHIFARNDIRNTPFTQALHDQNVPHRLFCADVNLCYRSLAGLLLGVYPRLAWFALTNGWRSVRARPRPSAIIIGTDVEALILGLLRRILSPQTRLVFETFIVTPRRSPVLNRLYTLYMRLILLQLDMAICHSTLETRRYEAAFPHTRCRFGFVAFGTNVAARPPSPETGEDPAAAIVSAGRSGRDYLTLARAIEGLDCRLHIVCDLPGPVASLPASPQITILRQCSGAAYIETLARALFVVVPLSAYDISAGQMVLLQAAALGRAVIITRTPTTEEYAEHGVDALMVEMGDVSQMRSAVGRLLSDAEYRRALAARGLARFEREHSTTGYVRNLVEAVEGRQAVLF